MFENEEKPQRAILAAADCGEWDAEVSIDELEELAKSAGAEVVAKVIQQRAEYDRATVIGRGKLEEIKQLAEAEDVDILIFDCELTAANIRNLEEATGLGVIDRTMLILDIFAARAQSRAGRLQVELAQYKYRLPRLGQKPLPPRRRNRHPRPRRIEAGKRPQAYSPQNRNFGAQA